MGPFIVPRTMASTSSATLAVPFKIKGVNYNISSACATHSGSVRNDYMLICIFDVFKYYLKRELFTIPQIFLLFYQELFG